ncbi:hypothetical protein THERMOT_1741 [Bathymodiolus thermophilus thioautotrophic gill symbiont]|uniref:Transcriptional regulator n=1 Tax=Bathymodiolus thermophilus thioautotrophic gill symbiont TaxID=2360 RepID=A0A1J5U762_9GAMM|nr:helix-turn-helix transcriptional regulator [Bathymodiolus thermophilus thioautotrophic gill symbiont]AYQ57444.1 transcriptional regulator [Bathymodiolus thermophilus thioautotrophic gill symbiont]OIR24225.1 hypothetical protein BGC33_09750 [Bathymodiolus thermophilus thioautotrophic gill symbiont]CAB5503164.1 hypothetical protein THERMOT_1741 [Bathymodiolus thermophilus thioautotrophic gill symbiont]CAB5503775.1 hypothetical protein THERMOS_1836 [Bathymodiolus thermophilus thioautotrophic gi
MSKRNPHDGQRIILRRLLIDARKMQKVTQIQLAMKLQKPQSFVSKYENGDRLIDFVEVYQICQALNYSFVKLMRDFDLAISGLSINYLVYKGIRK